MSSESKVDLLKMIEITKTLPTSLIEAKKQMEALKAIDWMGYLYGRSVSHSFGEDIKFLEWRNENKQVLEGLSKYKEEKSFADTDEYDYSLQDYGSNRVAEDWVLYTMLHPDAESDVGIMWLPKDAFEKNTIFYVQMGTSLSISWGEEPSTF